MQKLVIDLHKISCIRDLVSKFKPLYNVKSGNNVYIDIEIPDKVYPQYLVVIVAVIKFLKCKGIIFDINVNNPSNNSYISRINFYKELGISHNENFTRHDGTGRFVEITKFDSSNNVAITNNIMRVIKDNCSIDKSIYDCLNYCLFEMIDNVDIHANSPIDGYTVIQNFDYRKELRLVIADAGMGIYDSLTKTKGTKYKNLTPKEALEYCIKEKVTNGKGMGNGLFQTKEFILKNDGYMEIYSGDFCLKINNGYITIEDAPCWQGTLIYIKINTDKPVNYNDIFGENVPETVENSDDYVDNILW